jgi:hypothetical protein
MTSIEQTILNYILEQWHGTFAGVSAISVAEHFGLPHEQVLSHFDSLEKQVKGNIRRDVTLYTVSISLENPTFDEATKINTTIFFPSKQLLEEDYFARGFHKGSIPEYKMRLHKGASQIQLVYFRSEVLRKYLDHPEVYDVDNTVASGSIHLSSSYLCTLNGAALEKMEFGFLRFGKRLLSDGNVSVSVIMHDLAQLPVAEQRYWHSYEIDQPIFASQDPDFVTFFRRSFEAEFLDDNDPLEQALGEISKINSLLLENRLYSQESNCHLSYPVVNTYKSFCDSCSELYKLVGPDSMIEKTIRALLQTYFGYSQTGFIHKESGRSIGKLELFKRLCEEMNSSDLAAVIDEIKGHRITADHRIISPQLSDQNYITEFRRITQQLYENLRNFRGELEKLRLNTNTQ